MFQVLLIAPAGAPPIEQDLAAQGVPVVVRSEAARLVGDAVRGEANVVVGWEPYPAGGLLQAFESLQQHAALPVLLFTDDAEVATLEAALRSGVHAYVVKGYDAVRLRPLLQLARARFEREQAQRTALADLADRFEERKLVDRAKGILMREQQISEDEAFRQLRQLSMLGQQRVGTVSRRVIDAARDADAVNRAGQLRMLSQRLVKLYALRCARVDAEQAERLQDEAARRVSETVAALAQVLSRATFGDLLEAVDRAWSGLQPALRGVPQVARLPGADAAAEKLLVAADALTAALEAASPLRTLAVVNRAGRQRMLSQRLAKQALMGTLCDGAVAQSAAADAVRSVESFEQALQSLQRAPLSSPEIRAQLDEAQHAWRELLTGLGDATAADGRSRIAAASERLLDRFERLTLLYARAAQSLLERG